MVPSIFDYAGSLRRMGNDASLFREMAGLLREDAPLYLTTIRDSAGSGDFVGLKRAAHTLKGLVLNFGATRAITAAIALELIAESAEGEPAERANLPDAIVELDAALQELLVALDRHQSSSASPQPTAARKH